MNYSSPVHLCSITRPSSSRNAALTPTARHIAERARRYLNGGDGSVKPKEEELLELVRHTEAVEGEPLSELERTAVVAFLMASLEDFDVLTPLVANPEINDIIVASYNDVSFQVRRENFQTGIAFSSPEAYRAFVERLLKDVGKACTTATPIVDAALGPEIRLCVTHESFSPPQHGPMLTLRISRHRIVGADMLIHRELAPRLLFDYLAAVVRSREATVLIAGEVATGKTTLLRALAEEVDPLESLVVIEDTHEIQLNRPFVRTLLTREANAEGAGRITPAEAIRASLRMAMNRIILGELRSAEAAEAFIDVCSSGHVGLSTIHARSCRDALARLELFLIRAQGNLVIEAIRRQIANALAVIVFLGVDLRTGTRRIFEIAEVEHAGDGNIQLSPIFRYLPSGSYSTWQRESGMSRFSQALAHAGVSLPPADAGIPLQSESRAIQAAAWR